MLTDKAIEIINQTESKMDEAVRFLARLMDVQAGRVSVKATTTERLGFVGRGEGCEVWAVVLLKHD